MRSIFLWLALSLSIVSPASAQIFNPVVTSFNAGTFDIGAPLSDISTLTSDPVISTSITVYITFSKGPIVGLVGGDFTVSNCTLTGLTNVTKNIWSFTLNPTIDGPFTCQLPANKCTWNGVNNIISNLLTKTYDSGTSYDLQNATLTLLQHYRGHVASFTDCNDLLSVTNVAGMELLYSKNNMSATMFANGDNPMNRDMYSFGRLDLGIISFSASDWIAKDALITAARQGNKPSVTSFKNGDDSYAATIMTGTLYARNSNFETHSQSLPIAYTGLSDVNLSTRGVTYRDDYYGKTTGTSYYQGTQAAGDLKLSTTPSPGYVNQVINANGWYTNFTHWHWQVADYPDHYLNLLKSLVGSNDVFFGSVNQVVEYYYAKESVTSIVGSGNTITVNHTKDWPSSPYDRIKTPLWVQLNTTGSLFAGHDIAVSNGLKIRKISTNVFYVPIVMDFTGSSSTASIGITTSPDYVNLTAPVINRTGNSVTIDQACKLTIYRVHKPTSLASSITSTAIPTVDNTTVNFTVATGLTIPANMTLRILNDASHYFYATVISYDSGTGALSVSCSSNVGTGTFSSWTIDRYYHMITAEVVERTFTPTTAYTILATLDNINYTYYVAAINADGISAVAHAIKKGTIIRMIEDKFENMAIAA